MKAAIAAAMTALVIFASGSPTGTQDTAAARKPALQAFEHYEGVRAALAADNFQGVATHATALTAAVEAVGGATAKKAADLLAATKNIEQARQHFGELSAILVPTFQKEGIPGASAFMCSMKNQSWMQKGDKV